MRKTVILKVYGQVDPKLEDRRRRNGKRQVRRPHAAPVQTSPRDMVAA